MQKTYEQDARKIIDNAEECLRRLINQAAVDAKLCATVRNGDDMPAIILSDANDFDGVIGYVPFLTRAEFDADGEEIFPADDFDALKKAWVAQGFPARYIWQSDDSDIVFAGLPRDFWDKAFRKFNFPEIDKKVFGNI